MKIYFGKSAVMLVHGEELLVPAHMNFGKFILEQLRTVDPDRVWMQNCSTGDTLSYGEFEQHAVSLATALARLGAGRGDTVLVATEPRTTLLPTALAAVLAGATYCPMELQCGKTVLAHKLNLSKPKYVICSRLFWKAYGDILKDLDFIKTLISFEAIEGIELCVEAMVSRPADVAAFEAAAVDATSDVALVLFSSGTTGMSKGILLTHLNCISAHDQGCDLDSQTVFLDSAYYSSTSLFFVMTDAICRGRTGIYSENELNLKILQDFRVNLIPMVPVAVEKMLTLEEDDYDLSSLKLVWTLGCALPPRTAKAFRERYSTVELVNLYGSSEVGVIAKAKSTFVVEGANEVVETEPTCVGEVVPGVTIKVVDVETRAILGPNQRGQVCARGPRLMKGYLGSTSPYMDEQGFYLTGDLGYFDDHKRLYLVDRLNDVICYAGHKVCPAEVELVLLKHAGVREAAVVGAPAHVVGEHAAAFVVLRPGARATEAELQDYVDQEVPWYMRLHGGVRFLPELPRNLNGKVLRRQLREMLLKEDV